MKVIDSSFLIAIISDINCEQLIESLIKLKHDLIIPYSVCQEVIFGISGNSFQKMIDEGYLHVVQLNTLDELANLQISYPYLGFGELDTMLTCEKLQQNVHCILDDLTARKVAKKRSLSFTGTLGLLKLMKDRSVITNENYSKTIKDLEQSGFRMPREFVK